MAAHQKAKDKEKEKSRLQEIDESIAKRFDFKKRLGKGAYGIVWKALDKRSNDTVAVKKIFDAFRDETDAQRTFREVAFLKAFKNHPNVVQLLNVYKATNNLDIYLVFEYMQSDLHNIIKRDTILKDVHRRYIMYQLINGINYIHSGNVIHRDLKPSNVLIDPKCKCKLADFGLARSVAYRPAQGDINDMGSEEKVAEPVLTDYVATRWYRAPEILVASKKYTKGIDMWSLGCILGEMLCGKPLFQGNSTIDQIEKIVTVLPEATEHDIAAVGAGFGAALLSKQICRDRKTSLEEVLSAAPSDAVNLVKSLLVFDPLARLKASQALSHPYIAKFRYSLPETELNIDILPPFRDDVRLTVAEYRDKLYEILAADRMSGGKSQSASKSKEQKLYSSREKYEVPKKSAQQIKQNPNPDHAAKGRYLSRTETADYAPKFVNASNPSSKLAKRVVEPTIQKHKSTPSMAPIQKDPKHAQPVENKAHYAVPRSKQLSKPSENPDTLYFCEKLNSVDISEGVRQLCVPQGRSKKIECGVYRQPEGVSRKEQQVNSRLTTPLEKIPRDSRLEAGENLDQGKYPAILQGNGKAFHVRNTRSESKMPGQRAKPSRSETNICYEKRLRELEVEIEIYKKDVRTFCKDSGYSGRIPGDTPSSTNSHASEHNSHLVDESPTTSHNGNSQQVSHNNRRAQQLPHNDGPMLQQFDTRMQQLIRQQTQVNMPGQTRSKHNNALPANKGGLPPMATSVTPKKNPYFHLLSRGNREPDSRGGELNYAPGGSGDHIPRTLSVPEHVKEHKQSEEKPKHPHRIPSHYCQPRPLPKFV